MRPLAALVLAIVPACGAVAPITARSIDTALLDSETGTVYAFEVDDRMGRGDDRTVVVICNEELTHVCYRVRPVDALDVDSLRALQDALREIRRRRVDP